MFQLIRNHSSHEQLFPFCRCNGHWDAVGNWQRNQCKPHPVIPAGEGLEVGVGGKATQACAQPLRAVVAQGSKQSGWDSDASMAFPDNHAVLLCIPTAWDQGSSTCGLSLQPDRCPPPLLSAAGARQNSVQRGQVWWQDQIEDTWVLKTGQGPGFDDPSEKFTKAEVSLWEKIVLPT